MWELDYKESWVPKNWCFWAVVLERILESPLDFQEIQPVHPKGNQFWIFIGRTDAEAETPILWPPDVKSWLTGKDPDAGKDWRREEKGTTEDEMVGWYHRLNGHGFGWTLRVGDGQGGLACCSPWGRRVRDDQVTEQQQQPMIYRNSGNVLCSNIKCLKTNIKWLCWDYYLSKFHLQVKNTQMCWKEMSCFCFMVVYVLFFLPWYRKEFILMSLFDKASPSFFSGTEIGLFYKSLWSACIRWELGNILRRSSFSLLLWGAMVSWIRQEEK